jgi:hypothetical protein
MDTKALKKQFVAAVAMVLVAAVAVSSATYAWFINNTKVTATGGDYTATTSQYLLISADGKNYGTSMTLDAAAGKLVPVSTTDKTIGTFYKVKESESDAWVGDNGTSKAQKFEQAAVATSTTAGYYTDTIYIKSSVAANDLYLNIQVTGDTEKHTEQAMYIGLYNVTTSSLVGIYQLSNTTSVTGGNNTLNADSVTGSYSTKGINGIQTDGTLTDANRGTLTVTNGSSFSLANLKIDKTNATANTANQYTVYVWIEGTDPQAINDVANGKVKVNLAFSTSALVSGTDSEFGGLTIPVLVTYTKYTVAEGAENLTKDTVYYLSSENKWFTDSEGKTAVDETTAGYLDTAKEAGKLTNS